MKQFLNDKKEITLLIITFTFIGVFGIATKYFEFYNIKTIYINANNIYEHPLKVSNASLNIKSLIYNIHRDMKDIVLYPSKNELNKLIKQVNINEENVYTNFNIIEKRILGNEGLQLAKQAVKTFEQWKPIRDEVIFLVNNNQMYEAIAITKGKGSKHVKKLEIAINTLYDYAQSKAKNFKNQSESSFQTLKHTNTIISIVFFSFLILLSYYVIQRVSKFIATNNDYIIKLSQKEKDFETIFNEAPTPMAIHNEDGKILMINKVWEDLTGYTYKEINTTTKWTNKVSPNSPIPRKEHIEKLYNITSRIDEGDFKILTKDGKDIIWTFSSSPFGIQDGKRVLISTASDITELKKKDEMLLAQSRHAAMGEMLSMIAHQWRQPLSIIAMNTNNILLDIELETLEIHQLKLHSNDILAQTKKLSATIDDFRNFFKPNKNMEKVSLKNIILKTIPMVEENIKGQDITLIKSISTDAMVLVHPRELMQIFVNILTNAYDILVLENIKNPTIQIKVSDEIEYISTQIIDNGPGITEEHLPNIFNPYFTTKNDKNGSGLGLYMCKMIIENHLNGKIEVSSSTNGACFSIKLPKIK